MMRYQRKWKVQDNITHIKPFVTEINALHSPNSGQQSAVSNQQSVVSDCLNCDLWDLWDSYQLSEEWFPSVLRQRLGIV